MCRSPGKRCLQSQSLILLPPSGFSKTICRCRCSSVGARLPSPSPGFAEGTACAAARELRQRTCDVERVLEFIASLQASGLAEKVNITTSASWAKNIGKVFQAVLCHMMNDVFISQTHNSQNLVWGGGSSKTDSQTLFCKINNFIHIQMELLPLRRFSNILIFIVGKEIITMNAMTSKTGHYLCL